MTIRVLIVDDQPLIRQALKLLLANEDAMQVVGEASEGEAAIRQVEMLHPDVVLMDIQMPVMDGVAATREICQRFEQTKVLVLSVDDDDEYVALALRYGAAGYLLKNTPPEELALAIKAVYRGYTHLGPGLGKKIMAQIPAPTASSSVEWNKLTPREQEIVRLIATGANNREIAEVLYISEKTVKNHITNILSRLNLRDRIQVAIFAHSHLSDLTSKTQIVGS
ncbi:response regulator [Allocoleopsis franciscana]|uniref:Response regulator containing a CheY-like receiver domain and an HTH DNA-binding domain n=1 Tax=Allocoleopsis franciscana PCC 7113 TaxID=1173027 RepID=K9WFT2_9CYAN|nr:response regulator transcription factor [Allocoleopsis franciscana]AFZ18619.1 response regulator containing a CheY-like receiver domain and an HTH DNA-binding domain [Allocoleopsis franciscana PCC 7113]